MLVQDFSKLGREVPILGKKRCPSTFEDGPLEGEIFRHGELPVGFARRAEDHAHRDTGLSGQSREEVDLVRTWYIRDKQYATYRRPFHTMRSG